MQVLLVAARVVLHVVQQVHDVVSDAAEASAQVLHLFHRLAPAVLLRVHVLLYVPVPRLQSAGERVQAAAQAARGHLVLGLAATYRRRCAPGALAVVTSPVPAVVRQLACPCAVGLGTLDVFIAQQFLGGAVQPVAPLGAADRTLGT